MLQHTGKWHVLWNLWSKQRGNKNVFVFFPFFKNTSSYALLYNLLSKFSPMQNILGTRHSLSIYVDKRCVCSWAVRYDDIYRMDEIKSLSFHIMFYRLFRGVTKYIVYGNTFSSFDCNLYMPPTTGCDGETERAARTTRSSFLNEGLHL